MMKLPEIAKTSLTYFREKASGAVLVVRGRTGNAVTAADAWLTAAFSRRRTPREWFDDLLWVRYGRFSLQQARLVSRAALLKRRLPAKLAELSKEYHDKMTAAEEVFEAGIEAIREKYPNESEGDHKIRSEELRESSYIRWLHETRAGLQNSLDQSSWIYGQTHFSLVLEVENFVKEAELLVAQNRTKFMTLQSAIYSVPTPPASDETMWTTGGNLTILGYYTLRGNIRKERRDRLEYWIIRTAFVLSLVSFGMSVASFMSKEVNTRQERKLELTPAPSSGAALPQPSTRPAALGRSP